MQLKNKSLVFNTASIAGGVIMVMYAISILVATLELQKTSRENEVEEAAENLAAHATYFEWLIDNGFRELSTLKMLVQHFREKSVGARSEANDALRFKIANSTDFNGFWMVWEPDAFDGEDVRHQAEPGSDSAGRFLPYWHWQNGEVIVEPSTFFEVQDFYQLPKKNLKPYLLEQCLYPVNGTDSLLIRIVEPILDDSVFMGVIGADINLKVLRGLVNKIASIEDGAGFLVSGDGKYIVNGNTDLVGKSDSLSLRITNAFDDASGSILERLDLADKVALVSQIKLEYSQKPWYMVLTIPVSALNQDFISIRSNLLVVSTISALIIGFLLAYNVSQRRASDVEKIRVRTQLSMADARLTSHIEGGTTPASIYSVDSNFCYTGFNSIHKREMKDYFGADVEVGTFMPDLVPDAMYESLLKNFKRVIKGEQFSVTSMFNERYFTQTFNPVYDDKSTVVGLTSSIVDVTARIKAEQELEQYRDQLEELVEERTYEISVQKKSLQTIIDEISAIIFVRDDTGTYVLVNQRAADSFGMPINQIIGKNVLTTHHDIVQAKRFMEEDQDILHNGKVYHDEALFIWPPDKSERWLLLTKSRIYLNECPHVLGIHVDVTHLKETEMKLVSANRELQATLENLKSTQLRLVESEKMASIGQLSAGLAHEINNPINYVAGNLNPIKRDLDEMRALVKDMASDWGEEGRRLIVKVDEIYEEIDALMEAAKEGTNRVINLIGDLRSFARPGEDGGKGPLNVRECIESTVNLIRHQAGKRVTFEVNIRDLPLVNGTDQQFKQVCLNLLTNACQSIEDEGTIKIEAHLKGGYVRIVITDTGTGIPDEAKDHIFEPFFTTKNAGQGTGLGLAISYNLMNDIGGKISLLSTSSSGTVFELLLPVPV